MVEKPLADVLCSLLGRDWQDREGHDCWWRESDGEDYTVVRTIGARGGSSALSCVCGAGNLHKIVMSCGSGAGFGVEGGCVRADDETEGCQVRGAVLWCGVASTQESRMPTAGM